MRSCGSLVLDLEARAVGERHREPAVHAAPVLGTHLERQRREVAPQPEADAEEVAERHLDARMRLAVPPHAQHQPAQVVLLGLDRHRGDPDVLHAAGALDRAERHALPRRHEHEVAVRAGPVPRGETFAAKGPQACEVGERSGSELHGTNLRGRATRHRDARSAGATPRSARRSSVGASVPSAAIAARSARAPSGCVEPAKMRLS